MKKTILLLLLFSLLTTISNAQTFLLGKDFNYIKSYFLGETDIQTEVKTYSIEYRVWNTDNGSHTFQIDKQNNRCYNFTYWPKGGDNGRMAYIKMLNDQVGLSRDGIWFCKHPDDGRMVRIQYSVQSGLGGQFEFSYK